MIIADLSYIEIETNCQIEGGDNYAYVSQSAYAAAGNNSGVGNVSIGNSATAINIANVKQFDNDYYNYRPYYYYW